jgi:hypothetical protein
MSDDERVRKLSDYLWNIVPGIPDSMAAVIIAHPKVHMDALVEAEVVERWLELLDPKGQWVAWYRIPIEWPDDD